MGRAVCTDDQFIDVWTRHQSATGVAAELGIHVRNVRDRRNRVEARYGILLPTTTDHVNRLRPQDRHGIGMCINEARQFINVDMHDGVMVVGSDCHYSPGVYPTAHAGMLWAIEALKPQAIVLNGDIFDGQTAGRWARIGWSEQFTAAQELEAVQDRLTELEKAAPPGCRLLRTIGNHDLRFDSMLSANAGTFEGIAGFRLRDHLPLWHEAWRIQVNHDTIILHDWHSGIHSAHNDVVKGGGFHVVTGHTHELTVKTHKGFGDPHYGVKTGMVAEEDQRQFDYRGGKPGMNWTSGFVVLTWRDGMLLYPEVANVRDGVCWFRGEPITVMEDAA